MGEWLELKYIKDLCILPERETKALITDFAKLTSQFQGWSLKQQK